MIPPTTLTVHTILMTEEVAGYIAATPGGKPEITYWFG
jgi:hypothetical protein